MRALQLLTLSLNGLLAVALGALGAHALHATLAERGSLSAWQTAAHYQLAHAVAALALLAWAGSQPARAGRLGRIVWCWSVGALLFASSIYCLSLGGPKWLGPVTPLGGLCFIVGWLLLAIEAFRDSGPNPSI